MHKKINYIILIIFYLISCKYIHNTNTKITTNTENKQTTYPIVKNISTEKKESIKDNSIGVLTINKINLNQKLYDIDSKENNIEKNVTILKESQDPKINKSIMFIAAHSGTGRLAYFKDLDKLKINDKIKLEYQNNIYIYTVKDIWEIPKTGNISVNKEDINQLILTTCSPTNENKQLIINSILTKKTN